MKTKNPVAALCTRIRWIFIQLLLAGAIECLCTAAPDPAAVLVECTEAVSGDMLSRGFYITNYPGVTLDSVTLEMSADQAGNYQLTLDVRAGAYDGALIGSATAAGELEIGPSGTLVTFNFPSAPITKGSLVCFHLTKDAGPDGSVYYSVPGFEGGCPEVIQTEGTTPPLDTFRRFGVKITLTGQGELDFGDAPEGALAYPSTPIIGQFPTCIGVGPALWIQHGLGWAHFGMGPGPAWDAEADGNAGFCPAFNPNTYDQDECFADGDAGLIIPASYTISGAVGSEMVVSCPGGTGGPLGTVCQTAVWGTDVDIWVVNNMPVVGYVNVLMDWDQNGIWGGSSVCPPAGAPAPEHVLVNWQVPIGYNGPLSGLQPPPFLIGPNSGHVWSRFTITERPVPTSEWDGSGMFEDGETEDYLLEVKGQPAEDLDFGDAPDDGAAFNYPTLLTNNGARHALGSGLLLGTHIDAEADGQPTVRADGDDNNPPMALDDEDGVTFLTALFSGVQNRVQVVAKVPGGTANFSMWIDYNGDGDWTDPGEIVIADNSAVSGTQWYYFTPGPITAANSTYVRCRLSSQQGLTDQGYASDGEVEDYEIPIAPVKWLQRPDLTANGVDVSFTETTLADDFRCTLTGPITDLHVWTSFYQDLLPQEGLNSLAFTLEIYSDVPVSPENPYSHPGQLLWSRTIAPGTYNADRIAAGLAEWWHDPAQNSWIFPGDTQVYQYDFTIPVDEAYVQAEGTIYWLAVRYMAFMPGPVQMGWKSSREHWNDDAVWWNPLAQAWQELRYGGEHPLMPDSMDLAFAITGVKGEEPTLDFGDAPDQPYPTLLVNNGARHSIVPGLQLGSQIDAEFNGQPNANATGDDNANLADEDGVVIGALVPSQQTQITVTASAAGFLDAWIDYGNDGSWAEAGDQICAGTPLNAGVNIINILVPTIAGGFSTFARFRFSTAGGLSYAGAAADGEVEDYAVTIEKLPEPEAELGDAPDSSNTWGLPMTAYLGMFPPIPANYPTVYQVGSPPFGPLHRAPLAVAWLGPMVSLENEADIGPDQDGVNNLNPALDAPDRDAMDDGVVFPLSLPHCRPTTFTYLVNQPAMAMIPLFANVWFDWNRDGDWNDTLACPDGNLVQEWAVQNQPVPVAGPGLMPVPTPPFLCWHPTLTAGDPLWMRITLAEQPWPSPAGGGLAAGDGPAAGYLYGETEDYWISDYWLDENWDFGDAPDPRYPTLRASNGARHGIVPGFSLGPLADAEADGQPDATATGDDVAVSDDEDGVDLTTNKWLIGRSGCMDITLVSGPSGGLLDAWVDFNNDGNWDPSEQVFTGLALVPGVNSNVCFSVPWGATLGPTFARFRLSSAGSLAPVGAAQDGEVEDYAITILQPGNQSGNLAITNILHVTNTEFAVDWADSDTNLHYQLQWCLDLTNGAGQVWSNLGPHVIGPANRQNDTNATPSQLFYRVTMPWTP